MTQRRAGAAVLVFVALALGQGCKKRPPDEIVYTGAGASSGGQGQAPASPAAPPSLKASALGAFADCALVRFRDFAAHAGTLRETAAAYAADRSGPNATRAREAWLSAMKSWEDAELFRFGPAATSSNPGGKDLRDQIYPWPIFNRCQVEEQLVSQKYAAADFATSLVSARGLGTFEFLAFYEGTDNVCSAASPINANGTWTALGAAEIGKRKADYALAVAADVQARAASLLHAWEPAGDNFHRELAQAGAGSRVFARDQDALNAVSNALFYADKELKDLKLGRPSGIYECLEPTCPGSVESPYARASTAHVRANLIGLRRIFEGCADDGSGIGFDDLLVGVGASDLAGRMSAALAATRSAVDALDPPIEQALTSDPQKVRALHASFKVFTDLLKTEFVTVLNLELPKTAEGDND